MTEISTQTTYEQIGIAAQVVHQTGEYVAGRDIVITKNNFSQPELGFTEINLDPYQPSRYISPLFTNTVLNKIEEHNLVVVGGSYEFDKNSFIRHIAALLSKKTSKYHVWEWVDRGENFSLFATMVGEKEPAIFIFTQITPQDVRYDLNKFVRLATEHGHFVLMSTDLPLTAWKQPADIARVHWFETPTSNLYTPDVLAGILAKELLEFQESINFPTNIKSLNGNSVLAGNINLQTIAIQLGNIDRIQLFVRSLTMNKQIVTESSILELIEKITQNKQDLFKQWLSTLKNKEKETFIAASIFDGLYDDQFFDAVEKLVNESWQNRDSELNGMDYHDLDGLLNFFNLEEIDEKTRLIRSRFSNQRLEFFKSIWFSHRRQLLAALPVLVRLVKDSAHENAANWNLYSYDDRRTRLQEVVSHAFSDIGIIHFPAIENSFLQLASDENIFVQKATANALARWRKFGLEDQLFEVLNKWQEESRIWEIVSGMQGSENPTTKVSSEALVRSTIALTIGYASEYDKPNELSERLLKIFKEFAKDENPFVRERFRLSTLPQLTRYHLIQLKSHLSELVRHIDFIHPIALGIAGAYNDHPEQVEEVINEYLKHCRAENHKRSTPNKTTHRDKILITIILALSEIKYKEEYSFNSRKAYDIICNLQKEEYHIPVKKYYIQFIFKQIEIHASQISPEILSIIENLSYKDRPTLIKQFVNIYIKQRRGLENGEENVYFQNRLLPMWIEKERPLTEIEMTMAGWMSGENKTGQQIALDMFYELTTTLEVNEKKYIEALKEQRKKEKESEDSATQPINPPEATITNFEPNFSSKIIAWISIRSLDPSAKTILKNLLPVLVQKRLTSEESLSIIAHKLDITGKQELKGISDYLKRFPKAFSDYLVIQIVSVIALIISLMLLLIAK